MDSEDTTSDGKQLVVFRLGQESYGVNVGTVREIFHLQKITRVPNAPEYVEGVINLRGKVVPVIDLRRRLGLEVSATTDDSRIVVVEYDDEDVGLIVDDVDEVRNVDGESISSVPDIAGQDESALAQGFAKVEGRLVILVDIETILGEDEKDSPAETIEAAA
jgi:purine-binding chemotaxis protein CheW